MAVAVSQLMATDEAIFLRATGDFDDIAPAGQKIARGSDGVFDPSNRWQLTSASASFASSGAAAGQVVRLRKSGAFDPSGEPLVVQSVDSDAALTLRRPGLAAAEGLPPGPAAGATAVDFQIVTLRPQVEYQTYLLRKKYQIDENLTKRAYANLYDPREVEHLCCLLVLESLYADAWKVTDADVWQKKRALFAQMASDQAARTLVRWGDLGNDQPPTSQFGTRLSR